MSYVPVEIVLSTKYDCIPGTRPLAKGSNADSFELRHHV